MMYVAVNDYLVERMRKGYKMICIKCGFESTDYFKCKYHMKSEGIDHIIELNNFDPYYYEGTNWNQLK